MNDLTLELYAAIERWFPAATSATSAPEEWRDEPVAEWSGPDNDDELIALMCRSAGAGAAFGGKASPRDLFEGNESVLAAAYPSQYGNAYDRSSADAALAAHLAFWTGKNHERMQRIMERSALRRDKWDRREDDYLIPTILKAAAQTKNVYSMRAPAPTDTPIDEARRRKEQLEEAMRIGDGTVELPVTETLTLEQTIERFVFIRDGSQVADLVYPRRELPLPDWKNSLKSSSTTIQVPQPPDWLGNPQPPKIKHVPVSGAWETSCARKMVDAATYKAGADLLVADPYGRSAVNSWRPHSREGAAGDASLFDEHVEYLFGVDASHFLDWLAHIEQRPGELAQHGWVHTSPMQGTGRNWVASVITRVWPGHVAANFNLSGMLRNGFNGELSRKLIAIVDEVHEGGAGARWENAETLKRIVTEEFRTINPKYGRQRVEFNACRWLIFSNHVSALPLEEGDRRFNVVRNDCPPRPPEYYSKLYTALKDRAFINGVARMLGARDISGFNPGAHAVLNDAKNELVAASRTEVETDLIDLVTHWPADVMLNPELGRLLAGGGPLTPHHRHALERRGVKPYGRQLRFRGAVVRVSILRNYARWKDADPELVRSELEKVPASIFDVRGFLADHGAA
jgi:primase-polymerase (primpol)-like protein